ncbi:MAG TPA: GNAT family N-acetyltransferase [Anaerolineales bacterium]|nr:GNAT family N-acetyltransferase [Anaerolineales bacterium]HNS62156.1 GNAT family N-acetyltransferase [Anaerolineales bacterium]
MTMEIRRLTSEDIPRVRQFWSEQWSGDFVVSRGLVHRPEEVEGFVVEDGEFWDGLVTFKITNDECEVTSLDGLREGQGIGTKLLRKVIEEARTRKCRRVFLITTNDNLYALGFYQRRDFELVAIRRNAMDETRKLKPDILLIGMNRIPLRDEIELEMIL